MRLFWLLLILLAVLGANQQTPKREGGIRPNSTDLGNLSLGPVSIQKSNVPLCLSEIAYRYNVPIGVEVAPDDDLMKDSNISIQLQDPALKDVLNSIIDQNPLYSWRIEDGVVNVFPRANPEPFLRTLLETKIQTLSIEEGTTRFELRQRLTKTPELKVVLESYGVKANNEIFVSRDVGLLGRGFSIKVSDLTLRTLLNFIVRDSETKYWIVNRNGANKEYLLINL